MVDDIYQAQIIDHYKNPRNLGELEGDDVVRVRELNASCGDIIELSLKLKTQNSHVKIIDVKFKGVGCALSTAATSMLTERIKNQELRIMDLETFTFEDMVAMLGITVSPTREKCVKLPLQALKRVVSEAITKFQIPKSK